MSSAAALSRVPGRPRQLCLPPPARCRVTLKHVAGERRSPARPAAEVTVLHQRRLAGSLQPLQPARHRHGCQAPSPRQRRHFRPPAGSTSQPRPAGERGPAALLCHGARLPPRPVCFGEACLLLRTGAAGAPAVPPIRPMRDVSALSSHLLRPGRSRPPPLALGPPVPGPAATVRGAVSCPRGFGCRWTWGELGRWREAFAA